MIVSHACHHAFAGFFETGRMPQDLSRFLDDVALNKTIPTPAKCRTIRALNSPACVSGPM